MSFLLHAVAFNLLVLAVSANVSAPIENGQLTSDFRSRTADKVYDSCGSSCPLTCANPEPRMCILACKSGMFCPKGYYENSVGQCVLKEDCDNVQPTPDPVPLPEPLPIYPGSRPRPFPRPLPRPLPRPFPRPFPISFPEPIIQNLSGISDDFVRYPDLSGFQSFEPIEPPQFKLYPSLPKPNFQISPIRYNATAVANGAPSQPPAVVRTTGSNVPYISRREIPRVAPLIDLDPTVLRPALRVSKEQSSEDDKQ